MNNLFYKSLSLFLFYAAVATAQVQYEIVELPTINTYTSAATAINSAGQILGWYNLDGTSHGKTWFLMDSDETTYELPPIHCDPKFTWKFLTDNGDVYGVGAAGILYRWSQEDGLQCACIPAADIAQVSHSGQVLLNFEIDQAGGQRQWKALIWEPGCITGLPGCAGDLGRVASSVVVKDLNVDGEVVGSSTVDLVYKNRTYQQTHATRWCDGAAADLHYELPKCTYSEAVAINKGGDILIKYGDRCGTFTQLVRSDGVQKHLGYGDWHLSNHNVYTSGCIRNLDLDLLLDLARWNDTLAENRSSLWLRIDRIVNVNGDGLVLAQGKTIYGESHALLMRPVVHS